MGIKSRTKRERREHPERLEPDKEYLVCETFPSAAVTFVAVVTVRQKLEDANRIATVLEETSEKPLGEGHYVVIPQTRRRKVG